MKLVLDTHVFLWLANGDELPKAIALEIGKPMVQLFISSITAWEIFMLVKKDFIILDRPAPLWVEESMKQCKVECIDVSPTIAFTATDLEWPHRDPADRFIIATAKHLDSALATCDKQIQKSNLLSVV